jgi:hypothetical protein
MRRLFLLLFAVPLFAQDRPHTLAAAAGTVEGNVCHHITTAAACHQLTTGCTVNQHNDPNTYDAYLVFLKNQTITPAAADALVTHTFSTLAAVTALDQQTRAVGVGNGNQAPFATKLADLGQAEIDRIVGYLYYAQEGGVETCNCKLTSITDIDFHLGIGFDPVLAGDIARGMFTVTTSPHGTDKAKRTSIIAEMTPHYRAAFHHSWTLPAVQALAGKQVMLVGQLLLDTDHNALAQNCAFPAARKASCWRASAWEIHPITRFFVCHTTNCDPANLAEWDEL